MSLLPASIRRIGSKATEKRWRHRFPHWKPMGAFCCYGNQSFDPICPKTLCSLSPTTVMLHIIFDQDWPNGFRDRPWNILHLAQSLSQECHNRTLKLHSSGCLYGMNMVFRLKQVAQRATIAHLSPMCQGQISFKKHINRPWKPEARNQTRPSFYACPGYQQLWWWFDQKWTS